MSWTTRPDENDPASLRAEIEALRRELKHYVPLSVGLRAELGRAEYDRDCAREAGLAYKRLRDEEKSRAERAEAALNHLANELGGRVVTAETTLARVREMRDECEVQADPASGDIVSYVLPAAELDAALTLKEEK